MPITNAAKSLRGTKIAAPWQNLSVALWDGLNNGKIFTYSRIFGW
jgi:hypothetical protein